ncbi:hypothetical protein RBSWK_04522 [Rhodopirellula baltica SWK14]|uniref:Uncharacterized protein n=1 Tax=Rhodopirellula baltica SWK14 TaxID=993516 RepID=L7CBE6_RHOBT|nr:hypothetical protein RBSWK_04522 [Rhodopirellula baltica SWK14]
MRNPAWDEVSAVVRIDVVRRINVVLSVLEDVKRPEAVKLESSAVHVTTRYR